MRRAALRRESLRHFLLLLSSVQKERLSPRFRRPPTDTTRARLLRERDQWGCQRATRNEILSHLPHPVVHSRGANPHRAPPLAASGCVSAKREAMANPDPAKTKAPRAASRSRRAQSLRAKYSLRAIFLPHLAHKCVGARVPRSARLSARVPAQADRPCA